MAATVPGKRYDRRLNIPDRRRMGVPPARAVSADGIRVSWGGIWGGVLMAVGLLVLLAALGVAVGITATDPAQADASTLGTAAGVWAGASLLIALFMGGLVATRIGATHDRATGFWEGALVWVVSVLLMAYLAASGVGAIAGGAFSVMGNAAQGAAQGTSANPSAMVDQMRSRLDSARSQLQDAQSSGALQRGAADVKPVASRAAWMAFGALVISLLAAILGAMAGRRRHPPLA